MLKLFLDIPSMQELQDAIESARVTVVSSGSRL